MDFSSYASEFDRLFDDCQQLAGLNLNDVGRCWLFFTRSGISERILGHRIGAAAGASHVSKYASYSRKVVGSALEKGWDVLDDWVK